MDTYFLNLSRIIQFRGRVRSGLQQRGCRWSSVPKGRSGQRKPRASSMHVGRDPNCVNTKVKRTHRLVVVSCPNDHIDLMLYSLAGRVSIFYSIWSAVAERVRPTTDLLKPATAPTNKPAMFPLSNGKRTKSTPTLPDIKLHLVYITYTNKQTLYGQKSLHSTEIMKPHPHVFIGNFILNLEYEYIFSTFLYPTLF